MVETRPVLKHVSSLDFLNLIPGHAYTLTVQSLSGKLTNSDAATGRAGKMIDFSVLILIDRQSVLITDGLQLRHESQPCRPTMTTPPTV